MALIYPFQGYRYNKAVAQDLNLVVTQPYDKIPVELQSDYYRRSPYNVVRITRNAEKNTEPETAYADAGSTFRRWCEEQVLVREPVPALYAYFQDYEADREEKTQHGFIALLDLKHPSRGPIPHERTLAEPKMDRLRLMRSTESNDDLIYTLYTDERLVVNRLLEERTAARSPEIEVRDDYGVIHRVWPIVDPKTIKIIRDSMVPEELFIADGHHRFETSLNFLKECEAKGWKPGGPESFDKRLIACFNSADQGTTILPTHRLIRNLERFDSATFLAAAARYFDVIPVASGAELWDLMKRGNGDHLFGFYPADTRAFALLRLKEEEGVDSLMLRHGEAYRRLDVSILHVLILDRLLGITEKMLVAQTHIDYARERDNCVELVGHGKYQAVFFLNPTTVEQVQRVALLGERMPQKSTDFYPKLLTGLVLMKMSIKR
jgi:uncharacterized protein (DUF1015 family)